MGGSRSSAPFERSDPIESVLPWRGGVPECSRRSAGQLLVFIGEYPPLAETMKAHARRASAMRDASVLKSFRIARTARDILSQLALNDREAGHELL